MANSLEALGYKFEGSYFWDPITHEYLSWDDMPFRERGERLLKFIETAERLWNRQYDALQAWKRGFSNQALEMRDATIERLWKEWNQIRDAQEAWYNRLDHCSVYRVPGAEEAMVVCG